MRRSRAYVWAGVALTAVVVTAVVVVHATAAKVPVPDTTLPVITGRAPPDFISMRTVNPRLPDEIGLSDSTTGALVRPLLPGSLGGMRVAGLSLDDAGDRRPHPGRDAQP